MTCHASCCHGPEWVHVIGGATSCTDCFGSEPGLARANEPYITRARSDQTVPPDNKPAASGERTLPRHESLMAMDHEDPDEPHAGSEAGISPVSKLLPVVPAV